MPTPTVRPHASHSVEKLPFQTEAGNDQPLDVGHKSILCACTCPSCNPLARVPNAPPGFYNVMLENVNGLYPVVVLVCKVEGHVAECAVGVEDLAPKGKSRAAAILSSMARGPTSHGKDQHVSQS